jgi:limonene 1,2-monooxygenase
MRFGFFAMPEHTPDENWTLSYDRDIEYIVHAEKLGFDEYWVGEHHTGGYENIPSPDLLIAKASALTHRIRLGTGTVNLPYHDPYMVAERLAFLDHLTHGRLDYGFGGGGLPSDRRFFDIPQPVARPRTDEALDIIWHLLTSSEPLDWDSAFYKMSGRKLQVRPYQEVPPFAIAGLTGSYNYEKCGERGWMPLSIYFQPLRIDNNPPFLDLHAQAKAIEDGARRAGIDPLAARRKWRITREVYVADSRDQALADIRARVQQSYDYIFRLGLGQVVKRDREMPDEDLTIDWMIENMPWIIGSPDDCARQIHELREEVGEFGCLLINQRDWVTSDKWKRSLELFARYVMPKFQRREHTAYRNALAEQAWAEAGQG